MKLDDYFEQVTKIELKWLSTSAVLTKYVVGPVDCPLVKAFKWSVVSRKIITLSSTVRAIACMQFCSKTDGKKYKTGTNLKL